MLGLRKLPKSTKRDVLSRVSRDAILSRLNPLQEITMVLGSKLQVHYGDDSIAFEFPPSFGSGGGSGVGNLNWRGLWSALNNYSVLDAVYTGSTPAARYAWVAEIASGPSGIGFRTPDVTETGTVYWRMIGQPGGAITPITFVSGDLHGSPSRLWGFSGNNDYITCAGLQVLVPPLLRFSVSARTAYGASFTYGTYDPVQQSRVATNGAYTVTQYVTPQYVVGDIIYVVNNGGVLEDTNRDGRKFSGPT